MDYAEASYPFPDTVPHHFHHIARFFEEKRLKDIQRRTRVIAERSLRERRRGSRILEIIR